MKLLWLLLFSLLQSQAWGAACCGGSSATPAIISGDDKAQTSASYSYGEVVIDNVDAGGIWRKWDNHQKTQTLRMEGARILSDRWQAGGAVPIIQRSYLNKKQAGLGDVTGNLAYEYLPDWDYNPYRPKGIGFVQVTLPTGKSRAESEMGGLDSRGNGFWALGIGTLFTKTIRSWDIFTSVEIHRSFQKKISNSQIHGTLKPGYGGNWSIGGGYNLKAWRFGSSITWTYEDPVAIEAESNSKGTLERYATGTVTATYLPSENWAGSLSYSDQTWFGDPINTSLGRTITFQLQRKWPR